MEDKNKRPKLVTILGVLNIFDGIAYFFVLILVFLFSTNGSSETSMFGLSLLISFIVLSICVGVGILTGQSWSWYAQFVLIGLIIYQAAGDFISNFTNRTLIQTEIGTFGSFEALLIFLICFLIIVYLNTKAVKKYFKIKKT